MNEYYDVIIVGTGAAGLYCALMLPERKKILMLTKQEADLSDSFLAQGGICMLRGEDDYKDYFEDYKKLNLEDKNKILCAYIEMYKMNPFELLETPTA